MGTEQILGIIELLVNVACFFGLLVLWALIIKISDFIHELNHIKKEIKCTTGGEQRYWKRKKRRLWLSLLPFYRK